MENSTASAPTNPGEKQDLAKKHPGEANKVSWEGEEKAGNVFQEPPPPAPAPGGQ